MVIRGFRDAVRFASVAGEDAANKRMRKAGRRKWSAADFDHAVAIAQRFLADLGYGSIFETGSADVRLMAAKVKRAKANGHRSVLDEPAMA